MAKVALKQVLSSTGMAALAATTLWPLQPLSQEYRAVSPGEIAQLPSVYALNFPISTTATTSYSLGLETVTEKELLMLSQDFIGLQKAMDPEFLKVLEENSWDLYERA